MPYYRRGSLHQYVAEKGKLDEDGLREDLGVHDPAVTLGRAGNSVDKVALQAAGNVWLSSADGFGVDGALRQVREEQRPVLLHEVAPGRREQDAPGAQRQAGAVPDARVVCVAPCVQHSLPDGVDRLARSMSHGDQQAVEQPVLADDDGGQRLAEVLDIGGGHGWGKTVMGRS